MELHAQEYSPGYASDLRKGTSYTFWSKDFDAMAKKTMLKQISKFAPMSIDLIRAIETDQAVIGEDGSLSYVDGNDNADPVASKPTIDNDGVVTKKNHQSKPLLLLTTHQKKRIYPCLVKKILLKN